MKKLVALILVLGLATMANAALTINLSSTGDLNPSDTITISISGDGATPPNTNYWLIADGPGVISDGTLLYTGTLGGWTVFAEGDGSGILEDFIQVSGYADATTTGYAEFNDGSATPAPLSGTLVDGIVFHCEGEGDVTVWLMDAGLETVMDSVVIHQIPEPITLALLGLGGLFIRRK